MSAANIFRIPLTDLPPEIKGILTNFPAQNLLSYPEINKTPQDTLKPISGLKFDYNMVNCNQNLKVLVNKLKKSKELSYGMLLYGVSGSGKSYFGQFLAQELKLPVIKKRASDLIDKMVGQTEQNLKQAFKEARDNKAVLILDEADSFLFDRKYARQDFQVATVNELLTQMEDHPYPFIMTTNLKDKIDKASLRRFVFKIKFEYMSLKNINSGIHTYFGKDFNLNTEQTKKLTHLTAGDFKIAKKKMLILEGEEKLSNDLIYEYLLKEQEEKDIFVPNTLSI